MTQKLSFQLPDGRIHLCEPGLTFREILAQITENSRTGGPVVAALLENELHDLVYAPTRGGRLVPVDLTREDGVRIYARSLSLVMIRAAQELFPDSTVCLEHSLSQGIYGEFYRSDHQHLSRSQLALVAQRMARIIAADEPIIKQTIPLAEAEKLFQKNGQLDKVRVLQYKAGSQAHIYHCGAAYDYFYGYMLPSTGLLKLFELRYYPPGFILRFPVTSSPTAVPVFKAQPKLARIFHEFEEWGKIMEVSDIGCLDDQIAARRGVDLLRIAEALHEKKIAQIADAIAAHRNRIRLILVAGPSASGKTTFAQRLAVQLRVNTLRPISISIDDYFIARDQTPLDPQGLPDFEALEALDLELFNQQLTELIRGQAVTLPLYDFQTGTRQWRAEPIQIQRDQPIIIEGIHGLNPRLAATIPRAYKYRIYVSALTQLNIDDHNRLPTNDNRLIRRIVRDNQFRNHDAAKTISLWPAVRRGEEGNIFPFQEEADVMFNSALVYELAVLKRYAEPLLLQVATDLPEFSEAKRLLSFLSYFLPLDDREVPLNSILREFIGSSCFR